MRNAHQSQELSITRFRSERRKFGRDVDHRKYIAPLFVGFPEVVQRLFSVAESGLNERKVISGDAPVAGGLAQVFEDLPGLARLTGFAIDVSQRAAREQILGIQLD